MDDSKTLINDPNGEKIYSFLENRFLNAIYKQKNNENNYWIQEFNQYLGFKVIISSENFYIPSNALRNIYEKNSDGKVNAIYRNDSNNKLLNCIFIRDFIIYD